MADDVEEVRKAEARRGRRPVDIDTLHETRRMLAALRVIWNEGTEDDLKAVMREYGLSENSPNWTATLEVWNGERGQK